CLLNVDLYLETQETTQAFATWEETLGYVPQNFAKDALAAGDVFTIQLKEEIPTRHVVLVQDGGRVPNAAAREFARMLNSSVTQQNAP
ncbi:MAG TPA: hypothetical protein PKY16_04630, partial [Gemmiger qucibialis]|nr:hypothetical protein [Gemmiger qucibialis]